MAKKATQAKAPRKCEPCNGRGWYLLVPYKNQREGTRETCGSCGGSGER